MSFNYSNHSSRGSHSSLSRWSLVSCHGDIQPQQSKHEADHGAEATEKACEVESESGFVCEMNVNELLSHCVLLFQ